jgi:uncharacterized protein (TIGR03067 family)
VIPLRSESAVRSIPRICILIAVLIAILATPRAIAVPAKPLYEPANVATKAARAHLLGMWRQVRIEFEGHDNTAGERPRNNHWRITEDYITILIDGGKDSGSWTYRLDLSKTPAELDLTPANHAKPDTYPCLIHIEEDRITVCLQNYPARGRPADLVSRPKSGIGKFVYERVK